MRYEYEIKKIALATTFEERWSDLPLPTELIYIQEDRYNNIKNELTKDELQYSEKIKKDKSDEETIKDLQGQINKLRDCVKHKGKNPVGKTAQKEHFMKKIKHLEKEIKYKNLILIPVAIETVAIIILGIAIILG